MCVSAENEVLLQLSQDVDCKYSAVSGGVQMCHVHYFPLVLQGKIWENDSWHVEGAENVLFGNASPLCCWERICGFFCVFTDTTGNNRKKDNFVLGSINKGFSGANTKLLSFCFL